MKISSQLVLTFLLNACWQVAVVAALASVSSWLLRNSSARYGHLVWVAALILSFGMPLATTVKLSNESISLTNNVRPQLVEQDLIQPLVQFERTTQPKVPLIENSYSLNKPLALGLIGIYFVVLLYSSLSLIQAWIATRRIRRSSTERISDDRVSDIVDKCAAAVGKTPAVTVSWSEIVTVPMTIGFTSPLIILPNDLLADANEEVLTSAIGHELIHVRRRDYALNLVYELLYLPLSFHPGAALIRRRIRQTRELSCDELVAERILNPEAYARSLVKLASGTPTLRRLSVTTTVGIADADILEARIMSLLRKTKPDTRRKRMLLIAASLLLLVPCLAVASFAMKFDLASSESTQEPTQQRKERLDKVRIEADGPMTEEQIKERQDRELVQMKLKMANDPQFREELIRKRELEVEMRVIKQAALVRLARINMDQAIQIATSQFPGKVLTCNLDADKWEEPGKLAQDGHVFYRVVIVSGDDPNAGATHVWVNAVDGLVIKIEKELPRKMRSAEPQ
jgi:beta-lactamase regulating signal transducer with metallopeptidase domain/uncharacterized membrane protein YkoI